MTDIFEEETQERTEKLTKVKNQLVTETKFTEDGVDIETEVSYGEETPNNVRAETGGEGLKISYSVENKIFSYLWYDNGDLVKQDNVDTISELVDIANNLYKNRN